MIYSIHNISGIELNIIITDFIPKDQRNLIKISPCNFIMNLGFFSTGNVYNTVVHDVKDMIDFQFVQMQIAGCLSFLSTALHGPRRSNIPQRTAAAKLAKAFCH